MRSVVAGFPWQLGTLRAQRQLSSAVLRSLGRGDQWCNDTGRFNNWWLV